MTVRDTDHGYNALVDRLFKFAKPRIEVGILAGAGADEAKTGEAVGEGLTLLEAAIFNEFGTTDAEGNIHVPARSFIRAWFDENEAALRQELTGLMRDVVAGKRTKEQILQMLAVRCVGEIQQRIADGLDPENRHSTVEKKGSSTPLIATGQLRAGVTSRITER